MSCNNITKMDRVKIIIFFTIVALLISLVSCNAVKQVLGDPEKLEKVGREWEKQNPSIPLRDTLIQGTERVDTVYSNDFVFGSDSVRIDTLESTITKTVIRKVPVYITKTKTDTLKVPDTRRENLLKQDISNREGKITVLEADKKELKKEKSKWMWLFIGLLGLNAVLVFFKIKSSLKLPIKST